MFSTIYKKKTPVEKGWNGGNFIGPILNCELIINGVKENRFVIPSSKNIPVASNALGKPCRQKINNMIEKIIPR